MTSIKAELEKMLKRSLTLAGTTQIEKDGVVQTIGRHEAVENFMKTLASDSTSAREMADKIVAAWDDKTGELQKALCASRVAAVGNFIAVESTFKSAFFETRTLAPDEEPGYTNETANETRVGSIGEDGTPEQVRIVKPEAKTLVGLYAIASDVVRYKTLDILKGDVSTSAKKTIDVARDLAFKLDRIHFNLLNAATSSGGCFGAFSYEQARTNKATRIYVPHSGIITTHLPGTNAIVNGTTSGPTGTRFTCQYYDAASTNLTGFRPAVLRAIIDYSASWANVLPDGGTLVPTGEIIVPSSDIINIALGLLPANNDTANSLQAQVQDSGYFSLRLLNRDWKFIANVTIAAGSCYPRFNQLPGLAFEKPSWDREFTERNDVENWEKRWQRKAYGAVIPSQWRPRAMKLTYIAA